MSRTISMGVLMSKTPLPVSFKFFGRIWNDVPREHVLYENIDHRLLDSLVVECWNRVWEVPGSIPSQGPRQTKDVIKMVPVVPLFSTEHSTGKYWLFLKN